MSHSRRTPCCESEAIRYLQKEAVLMTGHEGAWFTTDSLAAALKDQRMVKWTGVDPIEIDTDYPANAAAIIQAAKEAERE